jgi:hypothetical protein
MLPARLTGMLLVCSALLFLSAACNLLAFFHVVLMLLICLLLIVVELCFLMHGSVYLWLLLQSAAGLKQAYGQRGLLLTIAASEVPLLTKNFFPRTALHCRPSFVVHAEQVYGHSICTAVSQSLLFYIVESNILGFFHVLLSI